MTTLPGRSRRLAFVAIVLSGAGGTWPGQAGAATQFSSFADVTATISLGAGQSWSGLGFVAGSSHLDASANVATAGVDAFQISAVSQQIDREAAPPLPYDQVGQEGGLASLIFKDENGSLDHPFAEARSSMGTASAIATPSGSGFSFTMNSNIAGLAFEPKGYAWAGVGWRANTFFKNLTDAPLTVVWTMTYNLTAQAHADHPPNDSAVAEIELFAGIGAGLPCCVPEQALAFNVAGDPSLDPPESMVPVRPNPPPNAGQKRYEITLAPGATDQFSIYLMQSGFAQVAHVPEPGSLWLVCAALGVLAFTARRPS